MMFFSAKKLLGIIAIFMFTLIICSNATAEKSSHSYCVLDANSKKVLREKDALQSYAPASTVKLLTAIIALDKAPLDKMFDVSKRAESVEPTKIGLVAGEKVSCKDLLIALLLKSANDTAVVLAEGLAQTEEQFGKMMNEKAKQIGCKNSNFVTASGLPAKGQYSCAYDLALIARESCLYPAIRKILAIKEATMELSNGRKIVVKTHNKMLDRKPPIYGKTGWTKNSDNTFAGYSEISGNIICVAVLGSPKRPVLWKELAVLIDPSVEKEVLAQSEPKNKSKTSDPKNSSTAKDTKTDPKDSVKEQPKDSKTDPKTVDKIDIKTIQKLLKDKGYYKGEVDGIFGSKTKTAVKDFQQQKGLKVDGIVGPQTWQKLQE